jgi:hypothetical protein
MALGLKKLRPQMKLYIVVIKGVQNVKYFFKLKAQPLRSSLPKKKTIKKRKEEETCHSTMNWLSFSKEKTKPFIKRKRRVKISILQFGVLRILN